MKSIWEIEFEERKAARPPLALSSDWSSADTAYAHRKEHLLSLWDCRVPGSRAPDNLFQGAVLAWYNQGYNVDKALALLLEAKAYIAAQDWGQLEKYTGLILHELNRAPQSSDHIYHKFVAPENFGAIQKAMPGGATHYPLPSNWEERIHQGWVAQIAGGAYGTALEGYGGAALKETFGDKLSGYVREVDTFNDDITFEIAFLEALDARTGEMVSSMGIAQKWLELIPYAWSAEYYALESLRRGVFPPLSGHNWFSEWIGAQMRGMVCGLVAPARPVLAARLAYEDGIVSHRKNGVYGEIHSAVMVSLAFALDDSREILKTSRNYLPQNTLFMHFFDLFMECCTQSQNYAEAWQKIEEHIKIFHWIHVIPNMAAVVLALYFSENSLDTCFRILGECGLDVDCNAGEAGTVLGVMNNSVPAHWSEPIGNTLETYLPKYRTLTIDHLSQWTARGAYR